MNHGPSARAVRWWPHTTDMRIASYRLRCQRIVEHLRGLDMDVGLFRPEDTQVPAVLVLSKRYDPASLERALQCRRSGGTRVLLDLCDNHFHFEGADPALGQRAAVLRHAVASVDTVVVASQALAEAVRSESPGQFRVVVVPDAAEPPFDTAHPWRAPRAQFRLLCLRQWLRGTGVPRSRRLVWFGNHGSAGTDGGMADLQRIQEAMHQAHRQAAVSLTVISNDEAKFRRITAGWEFPRAYLPWHADSFSPALRLHGACVIPVGLNPFTRCKTNNRVATALLHGLNVMATRIPSYDEFAHCTVLDDWAYGLGGYLHDTERRAKDVQAGQSLLAAHYSLDAIASRWRTVVEA
ncbi:hypothetical protein [Ideonella sp. BN130291]|uniref:hypothetical protein n=1 Tax=Ideonella sp. BN130291 TaxID=3112940 RepID=UPI002E25FFC4|nr:hypothetical protein [Ideonella sp. BN130291]